MRSLRNGVKYAVERALTISGGAAISRRKHRQQFLVLAYHNIAPTGSERAGDKSLHMPQCIFAEQLDALLNTHDVISLQDALPIFEADDSSHTRPRVAITFDDAYAGALTAGIEELRTRGLPATVFITPTFVDGGVFWWDVLADSKTGLDPQLRERALTTGRGLNASVLALAQDSELRPREMPAHARGASTNMLDMALKYERLTFAAHTWSHPNLIALTDTELANELSKPLAWLERFGDRALPMTSYPYGLADERVQRATQDAGYSAGFMIDGGWTALPPHDSFAIPRLNVPAGVSRDGFILRTAGLVSG